MDANIAFRALASSRGDLRHRLDPTEDELLEALHAIVASLDFTDEAAIPIGTWMEAHRLCAPTDPKDTPYVALALHHDAELWSEDAVLKTGLRTRGFTSFYEP